jgi:ankyrin repeat protein
MEDELDRSLVEECVGNAHGDLEKVRVLVERYPELVDARARWNETPIEAATQMGRRDIIEYLLGRGAPLGFLTACVLGREDLVRAELARDGSRARAPGVHGLPSLYFASVGGQPAVAGLLLEHGAEVDGPPGSATPLHGAVLGRSAEMVRWLRDHGADPSVVDSQGRSARQLAEAMGEAELAALLAEP